MRNAFSWDLAFFSGYGCVVVVVVVFFFFFIWVLLIEHFGSALVAFEKKD
jgi:hypothetical protein